MNKYGGINDLPNCDKRIYNLWFQMLRRCYDEDQQIRNRGKAYSCCEVCDRWKNLSLFAKDIQELDGYNEWKNNLGYCLDKDIKINGNKIYCKDACMFVPLSENVRYVSVRNPNITKKANEANKTAYILEKENEIIFFDSEKSACEYLGVVKCSVSSCYRRGSKCKGYTIKRAKMDGER